MAQADIYSEQSYSTHASHSAPKPGKLLFINKDANNLGRTTEEIYAVGSHVSKGSRKWKRTKTNLELDASTGRILSSAGIDLGTNAPDSPGVSNAAEGSKAMTLRWRLSDGRVTRAMSVYSDTIKEKHKKIYHSKATSPACSSPNATSNSSTPKTSIIQQQQQQQQDTMAAGHVQYYLQTIRPFARGISRSWLWIDDEELIMSSPALRCSVSAFASAFRQSLQNGLHSLVLPPEPAQGRSPLWPVPEYFVLRAQTISLLRQYLTTNSSDVPDRPFGRAELHAMMFLMRIEVFLGNREAALLHLNAIISATRDAAILPDLHIDIAMWKVNLMMVYKYRSSAMVLQEYTRSENPAQQRPFIDLDELLIPEADRRRIKAYKLNRYAIWHGTDANFARPGAVVEDWLLVDTQASFNSLPSGLQQKVTRCLILARYLLTNIHFINADTTSDNIRTHVAELKSTFAMIVGNNVNNFVQIWTRIPRIMFFITFAGAFASRGNAANRTWFVNLLNGGMDAGMDDPSERDLMQILTMFFDPRTVFGVLLREVWDLIDV